MIIYKNVLQKLKDAGYNTSRLRQEKILSESVIAHLRANKSISMTTLNVICNLLQCKPEDIIEYIPDDNSMPPVKHNDKPCSYATFQMPVPGSDNLKIVLSLTLESQ